MAIRHSTAADSSFTPQGKAAWEAAHTGDASDLTFTQSGAGAGSRDLQTKVREIEVTPQDYVLTVGDAGPAFRRAIAAIKANGGGRLKVPRASYTFSIAAESDCLLIDFANFQMEVEPGTIFNWSYWGLPLIAVIGADYVDIGNIKFVWSGTRGADPVVTTHFGYNATGILGGPQYCAHIFVGGSNHTRLHHIAWEGSTTAKNLEHGILLANGTATGPTANADVYGNIIEEIISNDIYFGVLALGQNQFRFSNWHSDRYIAAAGFIGPGHFLYISGAPCANGIIENMEDKGTAIDAVTGASSTSYQVRSLTNCTLTNLKSKRVTGLGAILNDTNGCTFEDFGWEADRYPDEVALVNTVVMTIAQTSTTQTISRNTFRNWTFHDLKNAGAGRSANCAIIGQSGNTYRATNATDNVFENINILSAPDIGLSHSVCDLFGQRSKFDVTHFNYGTAVKPNFSLVQDDVTRPSDNNIVRVRLAGTQLDPRVTCPGTNNFIILDTSSAVANAGVVAAGNIISTTLRNEVGTFTPALTFSTVGDFAATYTTQLGRYTRIGNRVFFHCFVHAATFTHTTAAGTLQLTGLPYAAAAGATSFPVATCSFEGYTKANFTSVSAFTTAAQTYLTFIASGSAQVAANLAPADIPTGAVKKIYVSGHYDV